MGHFLSGSNATFLGDGIVSTVQPYPSNMSFEKPQSRNPHAITVNQHVFPNRSIARFCRPDGMVSVYFFKKRLLFDATPSNSIFCAKRAWDQRAEAGYMLDIERQFQEIADAIVSGRISNIAPWEMHMISSFWSLWVLRHQYRNHEIEDVKVNGVSASDYPTKDQQEILESKHVAFFREGNYFPARMQAGLQIQMQLDNFSDSLKGKRWGILRALKGNFIVPDTYGMDGLIPISSTMMLCLDSADRWINYEEVIFLNQVAMHRAEKYLFTSDLKSMPLTDELWRNARIFQKTKISPN